MLVRGGWDKSNVSKLKKCIFVILNQKKLKIKLAAIKCRGKQFGVNKNLGLTFSIFISLFHVTIKDRILDINFLKVFPLLIITIF